MSPHDPTDRFDARARAVHAQSLDQLSPRVQAQLAQRRRAALQGTARGTSRGLLPWAGMATAGLALALVMQLRPPAPHGTQPSHGTVATPASNTTTASPRIASIDPSKGTPRIAATADAESIAPDLSEDPEFYLWLGDSAPARTE